MRFAALVLITVVLLACGHDPQSDFGQAPPAPARQVELPPQERARVLPNDLFTLVYNNQVNDAVKLLSSKPALVESVNGDGNTPIGLAISMGFKSLSQILIERTTVENLFHVNAKGEGYVYLAARAGFSEAIVQLAEVFATSRSFFQLFKFGKLDLHANDGTNALFVAANRQVAQTLEMEYSRDPWGVVRFPLWDFALGTTKNGEDFLHAAAADGRVDLIDWATERLCATAGMVASESPWLYIPGTVFVYGWHAIETYTPEQYLAGFPTAQLFNRQNLDGKTPMHFAAEHRQWQAIRALASCQWLDYDLADVQGNLPLTSFVQFLNPKTLRTDDDARNAFVFLLNQNTQMRRIFSSPTDRVNSLNKNGESALHIAARLADPYFYNLMATIGDVRQSNPQGQSPQALFEHRQAEVKQNGQ